MVKFGIIADTHITSNYDHENLKLLIGKIKQAFKDVDVIIHAGDVCEINFLKELEKIAPVKCVAGNFDKIESLKKFIKFSAGKYNIGVIHKPPENIEEFFKENDLHILIHGHSHYPIIEGTPYNTLIINPGSPTKPSKPPQKTGFKTPIARPSVVTLKIDEDNLLTTYVINLKI